MAKFVFEFKTLAEAEEHLMWLGFKLVPDTCNWTNANGDDAGCHPAAKGFRVEINQRRKIVAHIDGPGTNNFIVYEPVSKP